MCLLSPPAWTFRRHIPRARKAEALPGGAPANLADTKRSQGEACRNHFGSISRQDPHRIATPIDAERRLGAGRGITRPCVGACLTQTRSPTRGIARCHWIFGPSSATMRCRSPGRSSRDRGTGGVPGRPRTNREEPAPAPSAAVPRILCTRRGEEALLARLCEGTLSQIRATQPVRRT